MTSNTHTHKKREPEDESAACSFNEEKNGPTAKSDEPIHVRFVLKSTSRRKVKANSTPDTKSFR